jgi:hypothetical protein
MEDYDYLEDSFIDLKSRVLIKHVEGRNLLDKYGQYGCKKLNKRNKKKKADFRVVSNQ